MSRRRSLEGFAYNIAQKFTTSWEHIAWMALEHRAPVMTVDLLTGGISPAAFDIERNRILVGMCRETLRHIVTKVFPANLKLASLVARFGSEIIAESGVRQRIAASCIVTLVEDSGMEAEGKVDVAEQIVCP